MLSRAILLIEVPIALLEIDPDDADAFRSNVMAAPFAHPSPDLPRILQIQPSAVRLPSSNGLALWTAQSRIPTMRAKSQT